MGLSKRDLRAELDRVRDRAPDYRRKGIGFGPVNNAIRYAEAALDRSDPNQMAIAYRRLKVIK